MTAVDNPLELLGPVAATLDDAPGGYVFLNNLLPADPGLSRAEQTRSVFERMEAELAAEGMDFSHVIRTWFYLDDILAWYGEFNEVRSRFFAERRVFDALIPASTGIGHGHPSGAALSAAVLALRPGAGGKGIMVPSPLQCPALDYASSFSRAVEVRSAVDRRLFISGTASIEPAGATAYVGDVARQIELTMAVVDAILQSRQMDWKDATRAIAYFRDIRDLPLLESICASLGAADMPLVSIEAVVCRDDLLFEIEVDAAKRHASP